MCGLQLMELGFDDDDARKAAAAGGGDVAAAVAVAVEGGPAPGALTEAPVDISRCEPGLAATPVLCFCCLLLARSTRH
jgi:hypothetical protein